MAVFFAFSSKILTLYTMSTLYHSLIGTPKKVFRILDHCMIFVLIAGTYTPYTLVALKGSLGYSIFAFVWIVAIIGIVLNAINLEKYKKISMFCYLLMGWIIIFSFKSVIASIGNTGTLLLLAGGIVYTIGAIIYGIGSKKRYFHGIWHILIIIGSFLQYLSILFYVIR